MQTESGEAIHSGAFLRLHEYLDREKCFISFVQKFIA